MQLGFLTDDFFCRWSELAVCCINNEESVTALASIVFPCANQTWQHQSGSLSRCQSQSQSQLNPGDLGSMSIPEEVFSPTGTPGQTPRVVSPSRPALPSTQGPLNSQSSTTSSADLKDPNLHSGQSVGLTFALLTKLMLEGLSSVRDL